MLCIGRASVSFARPMTFCIVVFSDVCGQVGRYVWQNLIRDAVDEVLPHIPGELTTHNVKVSFLLAHSCERCSISTTSTNSCERTSGTGFSVVLHSRMSVPDSVNSQAQFHSRSARHLHHTYSALAAREHACAPSAIEFSAAGVRSRDYAASPDGRSAA